MKKMNSSPATGAGGAAGNATQSVALSSQLHQVAIALQDILGGRSGSAVMENVPAALRPGVQALLFQVLRQLGWAQAIRRQLAPRTPRPPVHRAGFVGRYGKPALRSLHAGQPND